MRRAHVRLTSDEREEVRSRATAGRLAPAAAYLLSVPLPLHVPRAGGQKSSMAEQRSRRSVIRARRERSSDRVIARERSARGLSVYRAIDARSFEGSRPSEWLRVVAAATCVLISSVSSV